MSSRLRRADLQDYAVLTTLAGASGKLSGIAWALGCEDIELNEALLDFLADSLIEVSATLDSLYAKGVQMAVQTDGEAYAIAGGDDSQVTEGKAESCDGCDTE